MKRLLHISASANGEASHGRFFGSRLVNVLRCLHAVQVIGRDLVAEPLPYPGAAFMRASLLPERDRGPADREALSLSERLIAELEAADAVVIEAPMHNFTVPAALKSWIDHVARPNRTFRPTAAGKVGLLEDRPVYVLITCGGVVESDAGGGGQIDFLTPYLRHVLATMGLRDVHTLRLDGLRRGDAALAQAHARAEKWIAGILTGRGLETRQ